MIKSIKFWIAAIFLGIISILLIDVGYHSMAWKKDVRSDIIHAVHDTYQYNTEQKTQVLENIFAANEVLLQSIFIKSIVLTLLLILSALLFYKSWHANKNGVLKAVLYSVGIICLAIGGKYFGTLYLTSNENIKVLAIAEDETSLKPFLKEQFEGKVVYLDFWGTACGPCLAEFKHFTNPLKNEYQEEEDLVFLYVCTGNKYLWQKQLSRYQPVGYHLFIEKDKQHKMLFRDMVGNDSARVAFPRYMIVDKNGEVAVNNANRPSEKAALMQELNQVLSPELARSK